MARVSRFRLWRLGFVFGLPLLGAACAQTDQQIGTQNLNDRVQARLAPELQDGRVAVEPLSAGIRVTIPDDTLFAPGAVALSDKGRGVLTGVIQGLLDPSWQRVAIVDSPTSPVTLQGPRTRAVQQYFVDHGLAGLIGEPAPEVQAQAGSPQAVAAPADAQQPAATPVQGLTITVSVVPPVEG